MVVSDMESPGNENDTKNNEETIQHSGIICILSMFVFIIVKWFKLLFLLSRMLPSFDFVYYDSESLSNYWSATEAIFTSEKIQEIIPLASNAILLLGQGTLCYFLKM